MKAASRPISAQSTDGKLLPGRAQTNQKVAGVESDGAQQQNGSRCKTGKNRRGAKAGPSVEGAASGRQPLPFRGFSREYVEAHLKITKEAIRRKEIIIKLLKSGSLTDKQLKAILPPGQQEATSLLHVAIVSNCDVVSHHYCWLVCYHLQYLNSPV